MQSEKESHNAISMLKYNKEPNASRMLRDKKRTKRYFTRMPELIKKEDIKEEDSKSCIPKLLGDELKAI